LSEELAEDVFVKLVLKNHVIWGGRLSRPGSMPLQGILPRITFASVTDSHFLWKNTNAPTRKLG
jgi:hypothetical protein